MSRALRIGTRGSALALWQARHVASRLGAASELVEIRTGGDLLSDVPLSQVQGKAFFTKEIEDALLGGRVDLAVHSLKDLATSLPDGLSIGAVLARDDARDVLITAPGRPELPAGARVGTSSLRRRAFLARRRPDLAVVEMRGNVPTRIERLDEGAFDALVLAAAGLQRLGLASRISEYFAASWLPPAPGQGAIAVQIRTGDGAALRALASLDDGPTRASTSAERALLRRLEGGCQVPVGAHARRESGKLRLFGAVCSLDGRQCVEDEAEVDVEIVLGADSVRACEELGTALAERLLRGGASGILAEIRGAVS